MSFQHARRPGSAVATSNEYVTLPDVGRISREQLRILGTSSGGGGSSPTARRVIARHVGSAGHGSMRSSFSTGSLAATTYGQGSRANARRWISGHVLDRGAGAGARGNSPAAARVPPPPAMEGTVDYSSLTVRVGGSLAVESRRNEQHMREALRLPPAHSPVRSSGSGSRPTSGGHPTTTGGGASAPSLGIRRLAPRGAGVSAVRAAHREAQAGEVQLPDVGRMSRSELRRFEAALADEDSGDESRAAPRHRVREELRQQQQLQEHRQLRLQQQLMEQEQRLQRQLDEQEQLQRQLQQQLQEEQELQRRLREQLEQELEGRGEDTRMPREEEPNRGQRHPSMPTSPISHRTPSMPSSPASVHSAAAVALRAAAEAEEAAEAARRAEAAASRNAAQAAEVAEAAESAAAAAASAAAQATAAAGDVMVQVPGIGPMRRQQLANLEAVLNGNGFESEGGGDDLPDLSRLSQRQLQRLEEEISSGLLARSPMSPASATSVRTGAGSISPSESNFAIQPPPAEADMAAMAAAAAAQQALEEAPHVLDSVMSQQSPQGDPQVLDADPQQSPQGNPQVLEPQAATPQHRPPELLPREASAGSDVGHSWRVQEEKLQALTVKGTAEECGICYEQLDEKEAVALPCHRRGCSSCFHTECIRPWLERNPSCPLCRSELQELVCPVTPPARSGGREQGAAGTGNPLLDLWFIAMALQRQERESLRVLTPSSGRSHQIAASRAYPIADLQGVVTTASALVDLLSQRLGFEGEVAEGAEEAGLLAADAALEALLFASAGGIAGDSTPAPGSPSQVPSPAAAPRLARDSFQEQILRSADRMAHWRVLSQSAAAEQSETDTQLM
eukprot:TRINITY_DN35535_c0_g1_i1.p1 TRINITY_DN35535_c0_g1~~TRINITY_DN35535_c0_g1_i1.p1  ORF type:complete len:849 (+),score=193.80 TRINITY_DN35535_c0_g1_i1:119-2665(+)